MEKSDFYYDLPQELIAQHPSDKRDESRLLVYNREDKSIEHKIFKDVIDYLNPGDGLVINYTRVIPARLYGKKVETGGKIEFLLLKRLDTTHWEVILKPGRRARVGSEFVFGDNEELHAKIIKEIDEGGRIVEFQYEGLFENILDKIGNIPLPPYIHEKLTESERYQTVYSTEKGSAAAPTAGLHFTEELLSKIKAKGIEVIPILLHVGLGTFRPVKEDNIQDHKMHSEYYSVSKESADKINNVRKNGGRIFAVGTTSVRTLETVADPTGHMEPKTGWTDIFIYPGYKYKVVDALITNFHLPESTLLMLISAFAGREEMLRAYKIAIEKKYMFFSFGDAMLIL